MSLIHTLKHTETEVVFKCYVTASSGGTVNLSLQNDMTKTSQVYVAPTSIPNESAGGPFVNYTGSHVFIIGLWWGLKVGKQLDITRVLDESTVHSHYYLTNSGYYKYTDFSDRVYANRDIRLIFDGPGHCIIQLRKDGWLPKIETAQFSIYDDVTQVGS